MTGPKVHSKPTAAPAPPRRSDPDFPVRVARLSSEAWVVALQQARAGAGVTDVQPELWSLYQSWLAFRGLQSSASADAAFLNELTRRLDWKTHQLLADTGEAPSMPEVIEAMRTWSAAEEAAVESSPAPLAGTPGKAGRTAPPPGRRSTPPGRASGAVPPKDSFVRARARRPANDDEVLRVQTTGEQYDTRAETPQAALRMRADRVANSDALYQRLRNSISRGDSPFTGSDGTVARRAYVDFLSRTGRADNPASRSLFVEVMGDRREALSANGGKNLDERQDSEVYARAALRRLSARTPVNGALHLGPDDGWMVAALTDPDLNFTPAEKEMLDRVQWHDQGLRTRLGELAARRKAAAEWRPSPGQSFHVMLNAASVFDGDPQVNAFTLAARAAGYSPAEIALAMRFVDRQGAGLYVNRTKPGQPRVMSFDEAGAVTIGGQEFVSYSMLHNGAQALRDARYALRHGYSSVEDYRRAFNSTWSDRVGSLGRALLAAEQAKDRALGLEQNPILGPLVRGRNDAMRELTLVGSNAANVAEMFASNAGLFFRTGNLLGSVANDEELNRYFENASVRVEDTFTELGRTYSAEEQSVVAEIARGIIGGAPKMAVNLIPGAALYYNALKHANHDINEFSRETLVDIVGFAGGLAVAGLASKAAGRLASRFIDTKLGSAAVEQVVARGASAIGGATLNVATDMGPAALQQLVRDPASLTDEEKERINKTLTWRAFGRNVASGIVFGLVFSPHQKAADAAVLAEPHAQIKGPLFRTKSIDGAERYFAAVATDKRRIQFIEIEPSNPKVAQKIAAGEVRSARQGDVDLALAQTRFERLNPAEQSKLISSANQYAAKALAADAERGIQTATASPAPADLSQSAQARRDLIRQATGPGRRLDQPTQLELSRVNAEQFHAAFGPGPYRPELLGLFGQPGFGEFAARNPAAAGALYRASLEPGFGRRLELARSGLKSTVPYPELQARVFEKVANDFAATERTRASLDRQQALANERSWVQERRRPPEPVVLDGVPYDVMGLSPDGQLELQRALPPHAFVQATEVPAMTAQLDGQPARILELVVDKEGALSEVRVEQAGKSLVIPKEQASRLTVFDDGKTFRLSTVGHGVARFDSVGRSTRQLPLRELPAGTELRLKGRENDGPFRVTRNGDGTLTATGRGPKGEPLTVAVGADDLAGRYTTVYNSALGDVQIDSARVASSNQRTSRTGAPGPMADPDIGALAEGSHVTIADGYTVLRRMTDAIKRADGDLTVAMFEIVPDKTGPSAQLLQAILDHTMKPSTDGRPQKVTLINNSGRAIPPEVRARLDGTGVTVVTPASKNGLPVVNHMKSVVAGDVAVVGTGSINPAVARKVEAAIELPAQAAQTYTRYLEALRDPNVNVGKRAALLRELAEQGVVINDPQVHNGMYAARAINGLVAGAKQHLALHVKELKSPGLVAQLIDRARRGVRVEITVRTMDGIDGNCQRMLLDAKKADPSLPIELRVHREGAEAPHANAIIADGQRAYVGSAFAWDNQLTTVAPDGVSFENGVVIEGAQAQEVQRQLQTLYQRQPGAVLAPPRPAPRPAPPTLGVRP